MQCIRDAVRPGAAAAQAFPGEPRHPHHVRPQLAAAAADSVEPRLHPGQQDRPQVSGSGRGAPAAAAGLCWTCSWPPGMHLAAASWCCNGSRPCQQDARLHAQLCDAMWLPGGSLAAGHRPAPHPHTTVHPACAVACLCRTVLSKPVNVDSSKAQALLGLSYIPLVSRLVRSSHASQRPTGLGRPRQRGQPSVIHLSGLWWGQQPALLTDTHPPPRRHALSRIKH